MDRVCAADCSSSYVITIKDKLDALSPTPPKPTIFKIHELLRGENAMAYEPEVLAIGPYHHGKERLQAMEVWKLRVFKSFLELQEEKDATKYFEAMKRLEGKARECYSESIICRINADEFAEMLLLDGCFIIQCILSITGCNKHDTLMIDHSLFEMDWVTSSLCRDMLQLENQIPLFVLKKLFYMTELSKDGTHDFHDIAQVFAGHAFNTFTGIPIPPKTTSTLSNVDDVEHLLGLLHRIFCPPVINPELAQDSSPDNPVINFEAQDSRPSNSVDDNGTRKSSSIKLLAEKLRSLSCGMLLDDDEVVNEMDSEIIPSATKLHDSGVTLKIKKVDEENPFEVTFINGVMEVPTFYVCDDTETAYRNLIAYEQYCQENSNSCFSRHAVFMDSLIDSPEDVALLCRCGIICSFLGDDEAVSTMCNKLCKHIIVSLAKSHYGQISKKVNAHYRKRRHRWMAKLRRDYFNNPWSLISFIAAFILLLLTVTQTVFSAMGS